MIHPFVKMAGCKTPEEFYSKYKSDKEFFKEYPHAKYMLANGQMDVEQNQTLPPDRSVQNSLKNVQQFEINQQSKIDSKSKPANYYTETPDKMKYGGQPCFNCGGKYMQYGGDTGQKKTQWNNYDPYANSSNPYYKDYGDMYLGSENGGLMSKPRGNQGWAGFGNDANLIQNQSQGFYGMGNIPSGDLTKAKPLAGMDQYSGDVIGRVRSGEQMKKGGKWIPKDLKKGRCTPMGTPQCPVGSPQYNLAKTFKKHHGFHKAQYGGQEEQMQLVQNQPGIVGTIQNAPDQLVNSNPYLTGNQRLANDSFVMDEINNYRNTRVNPNPYQNTPNSNIPGVTPEYLNPGSSVVNSEHADRKRKINPWMVGAGVLGAGVGIAAGVSAMNANDKAGRERANQTRSNGLTENAYSGQRNPVGAQGQYGVVGQSYGMPFAKKGGSYSGTYDQGTGSYFEGGGIYMENMEYDLDPIEIKRLQKLGYKIQTL